MTETINTKPTNTKPISIRAKVRRPVAVAGLSVITLGIYSICWWYMVNRELRDLGRVKNTLGLGESPIVSALAYLSGTCVLVPYLWTAATTSRRIERAERVVGVDRGIQVLVSSGLLALSAAAILATVAVSGVAALGLLAVSLACVAGALAYMQRALNRVWQACGVAPKPPARGHWSRLEAVQYRPNEVVPLIFGHLPL